MSRRGTCGGYSVRFSAYYSSIIIINCQLHVTHNLLYYTHARRKCGSDLDLEYAASFELQVAHYTTHAQRNCGPDLESVMKYFVATAVDTVDTAYYGTAHHT